MESSLVLLELVPPLSWGELLLLDELEVSDEEEQDDDEDEEGDPSDSAPTITVGTLETVRHGICLLFSSSMKWVNLHPTSIQTPSVDKGAPRTKLLENLPEAAPTPTYPRREYRSGLQYYS